MNLQSMSFVKVGYSVKLKHSMSVSVAALKFCFKTCVAMKFVDDDDDDDDDQFFIPTPQIHK